MQTKILLVTLLAAVAAAEDFMVHPQIKREIEARATTARASECEAAQTALLSLYTGIPTPGSAILSFESKHPQTDPCHLSTPASLSKEYASYTSEVKLWHSQHSKEIDSALSKCPTLTKFATAVPICTKTNATSKEAAAASTSSASGTKVGHTSTVKNTAAVTTQTATETTSSTMTSKAAGARQTGMAGAALAAAGMAVALL